MAPAPLVAIVGETASGKTATALQLASQVGGEIICADSRTVYRGMDIGTAKPTAAERAQVQHHVIDVVDPDQSYSAAAFQAAANAAIQDIHDRGAVPIMVGGTGLYIDSVLFDYAFLPPSEPAVRAELSELSVTELQQRIADLGIAMPANAMNPRHLIRAIETRGQTATARALRSNTFVAGIQVDREELNIRITQRAHVMMQSGLLKEALLIAKCYGWDAPGMQAPAYKAIRAYHEGHVSLSEATALFIRNDLQLAKRQRTWFKRNNSIQWYSNRDELVVDATTFLNKSA